ncbi:hypothetical protein [Haloechinothrix salitolerans]|uniref:Uncharacterized protein n=1 Tax=Haloechinothrix salitolerans TaxID=926830 RepID=A0ABW2C542_9PSEU
MSRSDAGSGSAGHAAEPGPGALVVELAEGFAGDDVTVLIDGEQMWHRNGVSTNYSVGIADVVRLPMPTKAWPTVEVQVGRRAATRRVDVGETARAADGEGVDVGAEAGSEAPRELRLRARIDPAGTLSLGVASEETRY